MPSDTTFTLTVTNCNPMILSTCLLFIRKFSNDTAETCGIKQTAVIYRCLGFRSDNVKFVAVRNAQIVLSDFRLSKNRTGNHSIIDTFRSSLFSKPNWIGFQRMKLFFVLDILLSYWQSVRKLWHYIDQIYLTSIMRLLKIGMSFAEKVIPNTVPSMTFFQ